MFLLWHLLPDNHFCRNSNIQIQEVQETLRSLWSNRIFHIWIWGGCDKTIDEVVKSRIDCVPFDDLLTRMTTVWISLSHSSYSFYKFELLRINLRICIQLQQMTNSTPVKIVCYMHTDINYNVFAVLTGLQWFYPYSRH